MKKTAGILKLLLLVSLLIGGIGSDVVLAYSYETDSINAVGAKASNQIEVGTVGADGKNVAATNRARTVVYTRHQRRHSAWMLARQQEADIQCWD